MGRERRTTILLGVTIVLAILGMLQPATAEIYVGGGTVVYKQEGEAPEADRGVVICQTDTGTGVGGACLPFANPLNGAVKVNDVLRGAQVAFQVCIDNNGDRKCTSGGRTGEDPCADFVAFSHNDKGQFFNPLGPLPGSRAPGCDPIGFGWNGYVVFLCEGVHQTSQATESHGHPATIGTISNADPFQSSGYGDFCGGTRELVVEKDYQLIP